MSDLWTAEESSQSWILWQSLNDEGMRLQYLITCIDIAHCEYISWDNTNIALNRTKFALFVTNRIRSFFNFGSDSIVSVDALTDSSSSDSDLLFMIDAMSIEGDDVMIESDDIIMSNTLFYIVVLGFGGCCLLLCGLAVIILFWHSTRMYAEHEGNMKTVICDDEDDRNKPQTPGRRPIGTSRQGEGQDSQEGVPGTNSIDVVLEADESEESHRSHDDSKHSEDRVVNMIIYDNFDKLKIGRDDSSESVDSTGMYTKKVKVTPGRTAGLDDTRGGPGTAGGSINLEESAQEMDEQKEIVESPREPPMTSDVVEEEMNEFNDDLPHWETGSVLAANTEETSPKEVSNDSKEHKEESHGLSQDVPANNKLDEVKENEMGSQNIQNDPVEANGDLESAEQGLVERMDSASLSQHIVDDEEETAEDYQD